MSRVQILLAIILPVEPASIESLSSIKAVFNHITENSGLENLRIVWRGWRLNEELNLRHPWLEQDVLELWRKNANLTMTMNKNSTKLWTWWLSLLRGDNNDDVDNGGRDGRTGSGSWMLNQKGILRILNSSNDLLSVVTFFLSFCGFFSWLGIFRRGVWSFLFPLSELRLEIWDRAWNNIVVDARC